MVFLFRVFFSTWLSCAHFPFFAPYLIFFLANFLQQVHIFLFETHFTALSEMHFFKINHFSKKLYEELYRGRHDLRVL